MPRISSNSLRQAHIEAASQEFKSLAESGVRIEGNVFSPLLFVKGAAGISSQTPLLLEAEGKALRAAFGTLGWAPEDECVLCASGEAGTDAQALPLNPELFREALEAIDPEAVVLLDQAAVDAMQAAYGEELASIEDFTVAMLEVGSVAHVMGRRVLALQGFAQSLSNPQQKQAMWARMKKLPHVGEPY